MAQDMDKRLQSRRSEVAPMLAEGEKLLAEGHSSLLTNHRFIQVSTLGKFKKSVPLHEVEKLSTTRQPFAKAGPLIIHTLDRSKENFGILLDAEWEVFQDVFTKAKAALAGKKAPEVAQAPPKENTQTAPKAPVVNPKSIAELEITKKYGTVTAEGVFSIKNVTIYSLGYVKVSGILGGGSIEKLLDIFGESDITKKTGLGRTATAILTGGINLALLPNQRGNLYLSIATPSKTHSLMKEMPRESEIKIMNKLVSAGKAAIARRDSVPISAPAKSGGAETVGVDQSLANLVKLHKDGLLDDAEYKAAKAKLLDL